MKTFEMVAQADKDGKTYKINSIHYNKEKGFHDSDGNEWEARAYSSIKGQLNAFIHEEGWEILRIINGVEYFDIIIMGNHIPGHRDEYDCFCGNCKKELNHKDHFPFCPYCRTGIFWD